MAFGSCAGSTYRRRHGARRQARPLLDPALQLRLVPGAVAAHRAAAHRARRHWHRLRSAGRLGAERPQKARRVLHAVARELHRAGHLYLHRCGPRRRCLPDPERVADRRCDVRAAGAALRALWHLRHARLWRSRRQARVDGDHVRHHGARGSRLADAVRLRWRVPHPRRHDADSLRASCRLDRGGNHRRHLLCRLYAHDDPARFLRQARASSR